MPIDFSGLSYEFLFGNRREIYKQNPKKLNELIDCQFCKLIFDYTKVCKHFSKQSELKTKDLKNLINVSQEAKVKALSTITQSLDVLSTCRMTSFTLTKN